MSSKSTNKILPLSFKTIAASCITYNKYKFKINKNAVCIDLENITITISTTAFAIANWVMLGNIY